MILLLLLNIRLLFLSFLHISFAFHSERERAALFLIRRRFSTSFNGDILNAYLSVGSIMFIHREFDSVSTIQFDAAIAVTR